MNATAKLILGLFLSLIAATAWSFDGRVVDVHDGDTITVLRDGNIQVKVRLNQIDAPEIGQPFGQASKKALSKLVFGKTVTVEEAGQDKYGRTIGTVFIDEVNANTEMVKLGMAWVYRKYMKDPYLLELEEAARNQRLGLWNDPAPFPPWEWRHHKGAIAPAFHTVTPASQQGAQRKCGTKRFCRQMTSCEEARFYLTQCGVSSLDGDKDGIPCESLCGHR
jgi:endonuclease YncB( thermonuclease family)